MLTQLRSSGTDGSPSVPEHHTFAKRARNGLARAGIIAGIAVGLVGGGAVFLSANDRTEAPTPPPVGVAAPAAGIANQSGVTGTIAALQSRLRDVPKDWNALAALGSAYVEQARISGDPSYYPKAQQSLESSLALNTTKNFAALFGLSALAAARHDFSAALDYADRGLAINGANALLHGARTDALVELGRYDDAQVAVQTMADLRPDLPAYVRASYLRELNGDTANALLFMQEAERNAGNPAEFSFVVYHQGQLKEDSGRIDEAEADYKRAQQHDAASVPAREGLARIAAARGRTADAIAGFEQLSVERPLPVYAAALAELYTLTGRPAEASKQLDLLGVLGKLAAANGVNSDLEVSLYSVDNGVGIPQAVAALRAEWTRRKSIHVADALAWALYADGKHAEAKTYADQALRLGTKSASFHYHRGMISAALGKKAEAKRDLETALRINPHFSARHVAQARKTLAELGS
ncbi:MAG: tetratricopeptide repeat protein [Mycobacteriales bacterium]